MTTVEHGAELARAGANITTRRQALLFLARRYPLGAVGAVIMLLFVLTALFANVISPFDPTSTNARASLAVPSVVHWLGADFMGRDVLSRIIGGARISLAVGLGAISLGCLVGIPIGLLSGYFGGWFDLIVQRVIDILQSLPVILVELVFG
jgi:peptide/nickel transport system permease protein